MTNEEISNLTDEQINVMITAVEAGHSNWLHSDDDEYVTCIMSKGGSIDIKVKKYCSDIPLMIGVAFESGITFIKEGGNDIYYACLVERDVFELHTELDTYHANPLRAAAIVYLKMKGAL